MLYNESDSFKSTIEGIENSMRGSAMIQEEVERNLASGRQRIIEDHAHNIVRRLNENEEVETSIALTDGRTIIANWIGHENPSMIVIRGRDDKNQEVEALLPHDDVQVVFTIIEKQDGQNREAIGFQDIVEDS